MITNNFEKKNSTVNIFPLVCWGVITCHPNRKKGKTVISRAGLNRLAAGGETGQKTLGTIFNLHVGRVVELHKMYVNRVKESKTKTSVV